MLPDATQFARTSGALGIADTDTIVVYDGAGLCSARRGCGGRFALFGAEKVFILDGGLPKWKAEGRPLEAGPPSARHASSGRAEPADVVASLDAVQTALASKSAQVVDARPADRFRGRGAGAARRRALRPHAGRAQRAARPTVVENGRLASPEKLRAAFAAGGVDLDQPVITSCGSGVTAATLWLALDALGKAAEGALRRLMVGMGRARRSAGRAESLIHARAIQGSGRNRHRGRARHRPRDLAPPARRLAGACGASICRRSRLNRSYFRGWARSSATIEGDVADEETVPRAVRAVTRPIRPPRRARVQRRHHDAASRCAGSSLADWRASSTPT